jgi:hypothetical protein
MTSERDRKGSIDHKPAIARLHLFRQGHEVQRLLCLNHGCEYRTQHHRRQDSSHDLPPIFAVCPYEDGVNSAA